MSMKNFRAEDMNMKVSVAKDSQQPKDASAAEQESQKQAPQQQRRTEQVPGQQAGQESGEPADQSSETSDEEQQADEEDEDSEPAPDVPDGTSAEILRWVGDDQKRAQAALDKENADPTPRSGLTGELRRLLSKAGRGQ